MLLQKVSFDLVIFYLDLLNIQWPPYSLESFTKQAEYFRNLKATKIALAQDEFYKTDSLDRFIREFKIDHVFSLAAESEWPKIYPTVDFKKVKFHRALPGYLDEKRVEQIDHIAASVNERPITIGYRAIEQQNQRLGRHGYKKIEIANVFEENAKKFDLITDISTLAEDTFLGNDWLRFLLRCKYTIAIEGGASILDHDGSVREKTDSFLKKYPHASFDEVEEACFHGRDGELNYMAISPKHLEACATRTCQILVEGDYNGILIPGLHYIELKRDFSNLDQVLLDVKQDHLRARITENAYRDIVASGIYSYHTFVKQVLVDTIPDRLQDTTRSTLDTFSVAYFWSRIFESIQWIELIFVSGIVKFMRRFLPPKFENFLRKVFA